MILPIIAYGHPTLKKVSADIDANYPELKTLIENMFETMYSAYGIGLAAPQIDLSIRLFVLDIDVMKEDYPEAAGFKKVFINPQIIEESGDLWAYNEGCLSIPGVNEDVMRKENIRIHYFDENFQEHTDDFSGIVARVIQHEYDHLEGKLFAEKLSAFKRTLLKRKLTDIRDGKVNVRYRMKFGKK